jgi:hypothetical protein
MAQQRRRRIVAEALILALAPAAANLLAPADPGFLSIHGLPALLAGAFFAGFYGLTWGLLEGLLAATLDFLVLPAILARLDPAFFLAARESLPAAAGLGLFAVFATGFLKHRFDQYNADILLRYRKLAHRAAALGREARALEKVNRVLENRVSGQKDSITLLQNQVGKLASLNLDQALEALLETIELFTETRSASIWVLDKSTNLLVPAAVRGWKEGEERDTTLDPETTIEGYVLRNRKPYSVRMLLDSSEFDRFEDSKNVITMPILVKDKPWGVLDIEDLPFERYSLYSESVLSILLGLAEPYLRAITEYDTLHALSEVDPDTGYPQFPVLYANLGRELERRAFDTGSVSLVVVEMANFEEALGRCPRADLKRHLFRVLAGFEETSKTKFQAFHFKSDGQAAFLIPGLDQDGASFLCLDLLTFCSGLDLPVGEITMPLELIVGFAASTGGGGLPDALIERAEGLLSMQRP